MVQDSLLEEELAMGSGGDGEDWGWGGLGMGTGKNRGENVISIHPVTNELQVLGPDF